MSEINYQALREAAEAIKVVATPQKLLAFRMKVTPQVVLALLDEIKRLEDTNIDAMCRIAELETNLAALSAESELARKAVQAFCDVVGDSTEVICEEIGRDGVLVILEAMKATGNMPATDAFLSEVRAQGVEMMREHPSIKLCSLTHICDELAAQIRKGVQL
ncbi:TPA: ead/Ea22-like family protein [Escherichia coli]|uniref:ead/Ea22-like family protein n=1 Tax=Escherichia coli TaxID=562 RepID=UPI000BE86C1B|nr:ead/Ea22-like family protein [Escherichia coli]EBN9761662.1 ead/Ea22-like family protein [Salmonella enterica]EEX4924222.1 ead/Ea22-like family protein [Escherichia albertii]EEQ4686099.1 ead/Ea22-like family protein [Escherichia coli]EEZ9097735.1 ead/Ea22-like family protein [Escherichia coli]EFB2787710.1 ead/Ea22-like family protein [Escherichia coli]